jgi:hypothetical protein
VPTTSVTLPALPAIVPAAGRIVRAIMDGTPRPHDAEVVASEMITCALMRPLGSEFTLTIQADPGCTRIKVSERLSAGAVRPATDARTRNTGTGR